MPTVDELFAQVQALKAQMEQQDIYIKNQQQRLEEQALHMKKQDENIQQLQKLNDWYSEQLKLNRKKKYGASSEQVEYSGVEQINLFNEAEAERTALYEEPTLEEAIQASTEEISYTRKKKKGNREQTLANLPVETIEYTLPEAEQTCPQCASALHVMTKEIRKELKIIPAKVSVIEHVTYSYACRQCEQTAIQTPIIAAVSPKALIAKSFTSPSALAYIINQKFTMGLPLYRQEQELQRQGVQLSRQTLSNWMIQAAKLLTPLAEQLKQELLGKEVLHADETTLEVLCEPGRPAEVQSYMWVYRSANCDVPIILYDYQQGRSGKLAKQYLKGYSGYLITDGWQGYKQLEDEVELCGCWAHAKRKFNDALAIRNNKSDTLPEAIGLAYCQKLFALEKKYSQELSYEQLHQVRQEKHKPLVEEFYQWVAQQANVTLPKSLLGKALAYVQNQKTYLLGFLKDGRIEISNNIAERAIKPFVIGRKNWLFCNTPSGAKSSAILYSIIETAKENNLNPYAYLVWVFEKIQGDRDISPEYLLPYGSQVPDECKIKT